MKPNTALLCGGFGLCGVPDTLIDEMLNKPDITGIEDECLCLHAEENALLEAGRERVGKGAVLYCNTLVHLAKADESYFFL